jgi:hypothetical protein
MNSPNCPHGGLAYNGDITGLMPPIAPKKLVKTFFMKQSTIDPNIFYFAFNTVIVNDLAKLTITKFDWRTANADPALNPTIEIDGSGGPTDPFDLNQFNLGLLADEALYSDLVDFEIVPKSDDLLLVVVKSFFFTVNFRWARVTSVSPLVAAGFSFKAVFFDTSDEPFFYIGNPGSIPKVLIQKFKKATCDSGCELCFRYDVGLPATGKDCLVCSSGNVNKLATHAEIGECDASCTGGIFAASNSCGFCDDLSLQGCEDASSCSSTAPSQCTSCLSPNYILHEGLCWNKCMKIQNDSVAPGCEVCDQTTGVCTTCFEGFNKHNGACYSTCPEGYYKPDLGQPDFGDCVLCHDKRADCAECSGIGTCLVCEPTYFLVGGFCTGRCKENCDTCTGTSDCSVCSENFEVKNDTCTQIVHDDVRISTKYFQKSTSTAVINFSTPLKHSSSYWLDSVISISVLDPDTEEEISSLTGTSGTSFPSKSDTGSDFKYKLS